MPQVQVFKPHPGSPFTARDNACWVATFGTAWYALKQANLDSDSTILVHSASGGVGSMLVQIAKSRGHKVVGVVGRSAKVAYCRSIGADHVIDKSSQPLWDTARRFSASYREFRGFHAVFDANGVSTLKESYKYVHVPLLARTHAPTLACLLACSRASPTKVAKPICCCCC